MKGIKCFYQSSHRRFPAVDGQRLVGIVSRRDVLQAVVDLA
ncbi:MAG: CBS domain-containing protein [Actinobacteria bacterium]|nr:CBS domain-containing protein [Actinomycetota bacterium]NIT94520.1 CBS domain-containing protein [Actinomycetota bacterium]NIV54614.1 CBS domain-containing protein [Actinomycetota bacterium]NIV85944.1 CBS domain-containing protein [Actinomycetota bacterium]NIX19152.1 CBS domain-containing protein [Actinomycetota bacterium]